MVLDPSLILLDPMMGNVCQLRCKFRCTDGGIVVLTGLVADVRKEKRTPVDADLKS